MSCCNHRKSLSETFCVSFPSHSCSRTQTHTSRKILYTPRLCTVPRFRFAKESQMHFWHFIAILLLFFFFFSPIHHLAVMNTIIHTTFTQLQHNFHNLLDRMCLVVYKWHLYKPMRAPFYLLCPMQHLILNSLYQVQWILAHHVLLCLTIYYHYYLIGDCHWLLRFLQSVRHKSDHIISGISKRHKRNENTEEENVNHRIATLNCTQSGRKKASEMNRSGMFTNSRSNT